MPLKAPTVYPSDIRSFDQWTRQVAVLPDPNSVGTAQIKEGEVTYTKLQAVEPVSIIGNLHSTEQTAGPITATADNRFLTRRSGLLTFDILADTDIPAAIARDTEVTTSISSAITSLKAETDPFPQYLTPTEGNAAYVQVANVLNGSKSYDPPSLGTGTQTSTTVTVTGIALGDYVLASFSLDLQGISVHAYVSATDTVTVVLLNMTGGTLDLASGTLKVRGWKQ